MSIRKRMKRLIGLIFFLNGWIAYSQPIRLNKLNFDHFTVREKILSPEFSSLIPDKFLNHPELGILPFEDIPCSDCIELIDHRNAFSRYFVKKNTKGSKFFQQKASGPINYKDINGEWREINYRLRKKGSKLFVAVNQPNPVSIDLEKFIISLQNSNYRIQSKFPELIWRDKEGNDQDGGKQALHGNPVR